MVKATSGQRGGRRKTRTQATVLHGSQPASLGGRNSLSQQVSACVDHTGPLGGFLGKPMHTHTSPSPWISRTLDRVYPLPESIWNELDPSLSQPEARNLPVVLQTKEARCELYHPSPEVNFSMKIFQIPPQFKVEIGKKKKKKIL